ncbi:MAG: restriction endonuclease [Methylophilus sp.]|uniref:nSTAND3 domain-containing NTPase n=1 Tax=Methylophilus sp. TaxID=29541 RepID=UPI0040371642
MSNTYDFQSLSPEDFERLSRDLLSKEWGVPFEVFKPGRDQGIDARFYNPKNNQLVIIQCKRYQPTAFTQLKNTISSSEIPKIKKLNPSRYVLVTSVSFGVGQKDELYELLKPWCKSPSDILGTSEVNSLISFHPEVVRAHFKLWLSSTAVLELILNANIWNRTKATLKEIENELCRFVIHDGFSIADEILETQKHCVIVGQPGIGKTTMARILLSQYVTLGYEAVVVSGDVEEVWSVATEAINNNKKLVILYDDFLGQISFKHRKFEKNEEHRFIQLLKTVRNSENLRFLLTTREYILSDAKRQHAVFEKAGPLLEQFTLSLGHYTLINKARILFNHLYFSDLPKSRLKAIVNSKIYTKIIQHENYNPRTIENICQNEKFKDLDDAQFLEKITMEINDPSQIWDHAFRNDIQPNSKVLLYILWSFGDYASLSAIKEAFATIVPGVAGETDADKFEESIKELDGNFIVTDRFPFIGNPEEFEIEVSFQNPSIRDYINRRVIENADNFVNALRSCVRFQQVEFICQNLNFISDVSKSNELLQACYDYALKLIHNPDEHVVYNLGPARFSKNLLKYLPDRYNFVIKVGDQLEEHKRNFELIESWVFDTEKWTDLINKSSFYSASEVVSTLLKSKTLNNLQIEACVDSFMGAMWNYANQVQWVHELENVVYFLTEHDEQIEFSNEDLVIMVKDAVRLVNDTDREHLHVTDLEDELTALDSCQSMLGRDFGNELKSINDLLEDAYDRAREEEEVDTSTKIPTKIIRNENIEIDDMFSVLLTY